MSSISIEKTIRTCKVNTGWANRNQSDRFQDPNLMVCPTWNQMDNTGRLVCADSFYTKRAGCNSAMDRVSVENNVSRPQYMEYIQLNAAGINGVRMTDPAGGIPVGMAPDGSQMLNTSASAVGSQIVTDDQREAYDMAGNWNNQLHATTTANCSQRAYAQGMAQMASEQRQAVMAQQQVNDANMMSAGGM